MQLRHDAVDGRNSPCLHCERNGDTDSHQAKYASAKQQDDDRRRSGEDRTGGIDEVDGVVALQTPQDGRGRRARDGHPDPQTHQ